MSYEEEQYAGDMGGRQAARDAQIEAARLQAEADELAARVNESQDVDPYDEGPTEPEPVPEPEPEPEPEDEDPYGEEAPPPVEVEEEEVEETTTTGEDDPYEDPEPPPTQEISGQDIIGDTDDEYEDTTFAGTILGVQPNADIAQMGYDTPEYIPPEKNPALSFPDEITVDGITFNLNEITSSYEAEQGKEQYEWTNTLTPEITSVIEDLNDITKQINDLNDPANNGFTKIPLDKPILLAPEKTDPYTGKILEEAVWQTFYWIHEDVLKANNALEEHQLTNPLDDANLPEKWTLIDAIDPETGEKIQVVGDHDGKPETPDQPIFNADGTPLWEQALEMPPAARAVLTQEQKEAAEAEAIWSEAEKETQEEISILEKLHESVIFWDKFLEEREFPILDDKGKDTGETEMKPVFMGDPEQYRQYENSLKDYNAQYDIVKAKEATVLTGYHPTIPELDKDGKPKLDDEGNVITVPDLDNPLRGKIFEQVPEGEGKYIKNENGDFIKSDEGTFDIKTGAGGLPFENLWSKYYNEWDDSREIISGLNEISSNVYKAFGEWKATQLGLSATQKSVVWTHHTPENPENTFNKIKAMEMKGVNDLLIKQDGLIAEFDILKSQLASGNVKLGEELTEWSKAASKAVQDSVAWNTLQMIEHAKETHPVGTTQILQPEAASGAYMDEPKTGYASHWFDGKVHVQTGIDELTGEPIIGVRDRQSWITPKNYEEQKYKTITGDFYHGDTDLQGRPLAVPVELTEKNWKDYYQNSATKEYFLDNGTIMERVEDPEGEGAIITSMASIGQKVNIPQIQTSGKLAQQGSRVKGYKYLVPDWARFPDGKVRPGYRAGLDFESYWEERAEVPFEDRTQREKEEALIFIQTGLSRSEFELAMDWFNAQEDYKATKLGGGNLNEWATGDKADRFLVGSDSPHLNEEGERTRSFFVWDEDANKMIDRRNDIKDNMLDRWIPEFKTDENGNKIINPEWQRLDTGYQLARGNKSTVLLLAAMRMDTATTIPDKIKFFKFNAASGAWGGLENIVRYDPVGGGRSKWYRIGEENIADVLQAYGGTTHRWLGGSGRWAPNIPVLGEVEILESAEMGLTQWERDKPEISLVEQRSLFPNQNNDTIAAGNLAYQLGSASTEWTLGKVAEVGIMGSAGLMKKIGTKAVPAKVIKPIGKDFVGPLPQPTGIKAGGQRIFAQVVESAPQPAKRVGGAIKEISQKTVLNPGFYAPIGTILDSPVIFSRVGGTLIAKGGAKVAGRFIKRESLQEIAELPTFMPRYGLDPATKQVVELRRANIFDMIIDPMRHKRLAISREWEYIPKHQEIVKNKIKGKPDLKVDVPGALHRRAGQIVIQPDGTPKISTKKIPFTKEQLENQQILQNLAGDYIDKINKEQLKTPVSFFDTDTMREMDPLTRGVSNFGGWGKRQAGEQIESLHGLALNLSNTGAARISQVRQDVVMGGRRVGGKITDMFDNYMKNYRTSRNFNQRARNAHESARDAWDKNFHRKLDLNFDWLKNLRNKYKKKLKGKGGPEPEGGKPPKDTHFFEKPLDISFSDYELMRGRQGKLIADSTVLSRSPYNIGFRLGKHTDSLMGPYGVKLDDIMPYQQIDEAVPTLGVVDDIIEQAKPPKITPDDIVPYKPPRKIIKTPSGKPIPSKELPTITGKDLPTIKEEPDLPTIKDSDLPTPHIGKIIDDLEIPPGRPPKDDFFDDWGNIRRRPLDTPNFRFRGIPPIPWKLLPLAALALRGSGPRGGGGVGARGIYGGRSRGHTLKRDIKDIKLFGTADFLSPKAMTGFFQPKVQPQITVKKQRPATSLRQMVKKSKGGAFY